MNMRKEESPPLLLASCFYYESTSYHQYDGVLLIHGHIRILPVKICCQIMPYI